MESSNDNVIFLETERNNKTKKIAQLNDDLRSSLCMSKGKVFFSQNVVALLSKQMEQLLTAVREFDNFNEENDPHNEHDCATIKMFDRSFIWKIDYYDTDIKYLSESPEDPAKTVRVITIMESCEY